jgi:hypothetical protein
MKRARLPETILEAMVTSVAELSGDPTEAQMRETILREGMEESEFANIKSRFKADPSLAGEVALAWLAVKSIEPKGEKIVHGAVRDADRNAVLLETGAVTLVALYAMYLLATHGIKKSIKKIEHKKDGTYVVSEEVIYDSFSTSLKTAFNLFRAHSGSEEMGGDAAG